MFVAKLKMPAALVMATLPFFVFAQDHGHNDNKAPYEGFEQREIKSLSAQDIEEIRRGGGWGLALPAELNGHPGPAHLLEFSKELELSAEQVQAISKIHESMRTDAIAAGEHFIAAEAAISDAFEGSDLSEQALRDLLAEAAAARTALRYIHLSRHLSTPKLLSEAQIKKYSVLRGYADDPCATVPDGHDPDMWRRHNGCE